MSSHVHYLRDVPRDGWALDELTRPPAERVALLTPAAFDAIGDYTRSQPTGPSPGRVYRKNLGWAAEDPDNWWLYYCERDPDDPAFVLHHPYRVELVS